VFDLAVGGAEADIGVEAGEIATPRIDHNAKGERALFDFPVIEVVSGGKVRIGAAKTGLHIVFVGIERHLHADPVGEQERYPHGRDDIVLDLEAGIVQSHAERGGDFLRTCEPVGRVFVEEGAINPEAENHRVFVMRLYPADAAQDNGEQWNQFQYVDAMMRCGNTTVRHDTWTPDAGSMKCDPLRVRNRHPLCCQHQSVRVGTVT